MNEDYIRTKYLIIGAGLTGLSAAFHLSDNYLLAESTGTPGGTASTVKIKGFKLDNSVHILYFRNHSILNWIQTVLEIDLLSKERVCSVWINGEYIPFPIQYNLSFLPLESKIQSVNSLIQSMFRIWKSSTVRNFEEYSLATYGKYLTKFFIQPYNEKLFGVPLSELNTDWLGDYVPKSHKYKMILSALKTNRFGYGRNSSFYYPIEGGISTLAEKLSTKLRIKPNYNLSLQKIILGENAAVLNDNHRIKFEYLISTIPLRNLLSKVDSLEDEILQAANSLKKTCTTLLYILVKGMTARKDHWIYVSDSQIPFYRITIPGNINPENCPEGYFALTLEYGGKVYMKEDIIKKSIEVLKKMKIFSEDDPEMEFHWKLIDYGYVIYDKNRDENLSKILTFLESHKIFSVGRYGAWEYSNMEDALLHGKRVAEKLSRLT